MLWQLVQRNTFSTGVLVMAAALAVDADWKVESLARHTVLKDAVHRFAADRPGPALSIIRIDNINATALPLQGHLAHPFIEVRAPTRQILEPSGDVLAMLLRHGIGLDIDHRHLGV